MVRSKSSTNRTIKSSAANSSVASTKPHTAAAGRTTKAVASKKSTTKRPKSAQAIYGANANT